MSLLRLVVTFLGSLFKSRRQLVLENLALQQQVAMLRQSVKRPTATAADRMFWILYSRYVDGWRTALHALHPEIAVVSAGHENRHGHPRQEVVQRLEPHTIAVDAHSFVSATGKRGNYTWHPDSQYTEAIYSTVTNGKVRVTTDGNSWQVTTEE